MHYIPLHNIKIGMWYITNETNITGPVILELYTNFNIYITI
jgi:hypothetical protein